MRESVRAWGSSCRSTVLVGVVVMAVLASSAWADWPQFLGPNRSDVALDDGHLARQWPADGPKVLWSVAVGQGFAGPAVYGDSVLILDREGNEGDVVRRIRLADGTEVWNFPYEAPGELPYDGGRSTPATDGTMVYTTGPFGHIHAVTFADGKPVWEADLLGDWDAKRPNWGVAQSPLLLGDTVVVAPWGKRAAVVAYEKATGKVRWSTPNTDGIAQDYQSPVPMTLAGREMIVASGKNGYTIGVDAKTGERLWTYNDYSCRIHIPSPVAVPGDRVFMAGGYNAGSAMFKVERDGDGYAARTLWQNMSMGSKTGQAPVYKGYIYGNSSEPSNGLRCVSLDGDVVWETGRRLRFGLGNLIIVNDLIFVLQGDSGELVMVEATPEGYHELGRARVLAGKQVWGPLAYSDGKLVLRDQGKLVCVDLTAR